MMIRRLIPTATLFVVLTCVLSVSLTPAFGQSKKKGRAKESATSVAPQRPTVWRDPGAGPGGKKHAPKPPFTFVEEDTSGTNPKVKVTDAAGQRWGVKWGSEIHSEVFASRLVWAAGYDVEAAYYGNSRKNKPAQKCRPLATI
jgi:hypothetical protein